jgi:hypothetical protein
VTHACTRNVTIKRYRRDAGGGEGGGEGRQLPEARILTRTSPAFGGSTCGRSS